MTISGIFANLSCSDLQASKPWFVSIFGREPDAAPMKGLVEWHHETAGGFQLFEDSAKAGKGTLTLIVNDVAEERGRLVELGIEPGKVEEADYTRIAGASDPDGNLVVLAQPN